MKWLFVLVVVCLASSSDAWTDPRHSLVPFEVVDTNTKEYREGVRAAYEARRARLVYEHRTQGLIGDHSRVPMYVPLERTRAVEGEYDGDDIPIIAIAIGIAVVSLVGVGIFQEIGMWLDVLSM